VNALATCNTPGGLFSRVAIHSAPLSLKPLGEVRVQTDLLVEEMGCGDAGIDVMACMRDVAKEDLVLAEASVPLGLASGAFLPTVDGDLCTDQPRAVIESGAWDGPPVILGTMQDEYSHRWSGITEAQYPAYVTAAVGAVHAADVLAQYPLDRFPSPTVAYTEMMSDKNVTCPHRRYARLAATAGVTLYFYRFRETLEPEVRIGYGAYHTSDFLYFFQHMDGDEFFVATDDAAVQEIMLRYWTRLAASGDPSGGTDPSWPVFTTAREQFLSVEAIPFIDDHLDEDDCNFWDLLLGL
jgi:para-nitrobenzyl esterase